MNCEPDTSWKVAYVVSEKNIRLSAQLIDATTGNHIWAERYDREFADVFALQDEITQSIVGSIAPQIGDAEMEKRRQLRGSDTNAYHLALRARWLIRSGFNNNNVEEREEGMRLAQKAISLDPSCVLAHKCIAEYHRFEIIYAGLRPRQHTLQAARDSAEGVLLLDRNDAFGFYCLGTAKFYEGYYDDAISDLEQAHRLNPNDPFALTFLSWIKALCGLNAEAIENADLAMRLCPRNNIVIGSTNFARSLVAFQQRDYELAVQTARRSIQAYPGAPMRYSVLAASLIELGKKEEAIEAVRQLRARRPEFLKALFKGEYTVFRNADENQRYTSTVRKAAAPLDD
jgi:adenylate cyclase